MSSSASPGDVPARVEALLAELVGEAEGADAAQLLAWLANRGAARLQTLSRAQATARKGEADWAVWAQLQNASRTLILQAATCRDLAQRLGSSDA